MGRWIVLAGIVAIATIGYYATVYPSEGLGRRNVYAIAATLQQKAETAIKKSGAQGWAMVRVDGQVAVLTGEAPTESDRQDVIDAVRASEWAGGKWVGGITAVRNEMTLAKAVTPYEWTAVLGERGRVRLGGLVPGQRHRQAIKAEAQRLFPEGVEDEMAIAQGAPTGPWSDTAIWALAQLSRLASGEARFKDKVVLIRGAAPNATIKSDIENAASKIGRPYRGSTDLRAVGTFDAAPLMPTEPVAIATPPAVPPAPAATTSAVPTQVASTAPSTPAGTTATPPPAATPPAAPPHAAVPPAPVPAATPDPAATTALAPAEPAPPVQRDDGVECQKLVDKSMTNNTIAFAVGSSEVRSVANEMLNNLAQAAAKCPLKIRIYGHIDESESGDPNLSQARADTVAGYLVRRGVPRKRITATGVGTDQPVGDSATASGQAKNRRIEITVTN